jgi:glycosyltransferase involved in cell wall biosynthesis
MKALQISFTDFSGGGGGTVAMYRLCQGLSQLNVEYKILAKVKNLDSAQSAVIPRIRIPESILRKITKPLGLNDIHTLGSFRLNRHPFVQWADVINAHVIHSDYFNYLALPTLAAQTPIILTLHDMWAFTGHCAYSYDCSRWQTGCGACPYPDSYPSILRDNTALEWKLKRWVYSRTKLTIITPSTWLKQQAQRSLLSHFDIHHIPNGLDVEAYSPVDKTIARQVLDLPTDQLVVMSCAEMLGDRRKGMDLLVQSLNKLPDDIKTTTTVLLMGKISEDLTHELPLPVKQLGYVTSDYHKVLAFSAADIFAFPTRADNLPIVLQESMACGTPMVSFAVGGVPDLVRPNITGLLATAENVEEFSAQITTLLRNKEYRQKMATNCRKIAVQEYSLELQAQRYADLYQSLVPAGK